jgi:hypothetical protein
MKTPRRREMNFSAQNIFEQKLNIYIRVEEPRYIRELNEQIHVAVGAVGAASEGAEQGERADAERAQLVEVGADALDELIAVCDGGLSM